MELRCRRLLSVELIENSHEWKKMSFYEKHFRVEKIARRIPERKFKFKSCFYESFYQLGEEKLNTVVL